MTAKWMVALCWRSFVGLVFCLCVLPSHALQAREHQHPLHLLETAPSQMDPESSQVAPMQFLLDNSRLHYAGPGMRWRLSKDMRNSSDHYIEWGSLLEGADQGDGWVKVGQFYLPTEIEGVKVLVATAKSLKVWYEPTEMRAADGSWVPCNIRGWGSKENTYDITLRPPGLSAYNASNVAAEKLRKVVRVREFLPATLPQRAHAAEDSISLRLQDPEGSQTVVKVSCRSTLRAMMRTACEHLQISRQACLSSVRFMRERVQEVTEHSRTEQVYPTDYACSIGLQDGDTIAMRPVESQLAQV
eukprot:CAMPEP_0171096356 /NCGR_PEP_ID=MMETSP0766_2-20121228/44412_1 /TAXON_ID=439317 /ORGANISM="Gambierdiscus australes, Strain CAWD 149" /LENGTH=300 /DNA_ID=CAMNT_0011555321 /DNA_START=17 /DNA_END=919 /DNA_ORIENTATION=-